MNRAFSPWASVLTLLALAGVLPFIVAVGCSEGTNSDHYAPLDYESNPHSEKYHFEEVDDVVDQFMLDYPSVEGVTLAVVRGNEGQIYEESYGAFERDRISLIASTGKVLSAGIILSLVDDGLIDLDRPIAEYLTWGDHHPSVTMRHILSMMAGLPALISEAGWCLPHACECDPATTMLECARVVFEDEIMSIPPGEKFRYGRWQLAGAVAEVVSGRSWAELEREKLIEPCGLPSTGYRNVKNDAYPEAFDGDPANVPETGNPSLGGGAYSTVNDYSKVLLMHLRAGLCEGGRALSPEMVEAMQADLVPEGVLLPGWRDGAINYGMGWWKHEDGLLIDSGAFGARSLLHPAEDWGAVFIIEDESENGTELRKRLVQTIRAAVRAADAFEVQAP